MDEKIKDLTLLLLYLTSWKEHEFPFELRRSWKGYPFEVLNELTDQDLIRESVASTSSNRRAYQGVYHKIKRYKKIAGKEKQEELINELMELYRKRPAFIEELERIR